MLRSLKEFIKYQVDAANGDIGTVRDFFFDDHGWTVRYLVVRTGTWLSARDVLLPPPSIEKADWATQRLTLSLTRHQVEESPDIDADKPVSLEMMQRLAGFYGPLFPVSPSRETVAQEAKRAQEGEHNLRSVREVTGYGIQATDGPIGHVGDFIVEDESWRLRYLIVDTGNWIPGRKFLISPHWVESVAWEDSKVEVGLERDRIKDSPRYDPSEPVNREYEGRLYDYYGRQKYWG